MNTIRIAGVVKESFVDGPGIRFAIFTQGCAHACPECQNPETWDFKGGYDCEFTRVLDEIDKNPLLDGVTFTGGDPVYQSQACYEIGLEIKKRNLNIVIFTGFTYEELLDMGEKDHWVKDFLSICDILIEGRYEKDRRDLSLRFRGSRNQRIIDMNLTRAGLEAGTLKPGEYILDERYM